MFKVIKLSNLFIGFGLIGLLSACAPTPNDVSLSFTPGQCVTGASPGYEATASSQGWSGAFPLNAAMPANSPYCMGVTMTNNNSGDNSNNIQVFQGGLQLTYTIAGATYSGYMVDFSAANIPASTFTYAPVQQLGNIALFDPSNCVTTIGSKVNTLSKGGGTCTFYLSLIGESFPVGTYPIQLLINYTNGNASYNVAGGFNQRVNLYAGGDFSTPGSVANNLALYNGSSSSAAESLPVTFPGQNVKLLIRDAYGDLFAYDGISVYVFNGGLAWLNIGLPSGVTQVNALSNDTLGNIFAATNAGIWTYSLSNTSLGWVNVAGVSGSGNFAAVQATVASGSSTNNLFATNNSYQTNPALLACAWASGGTCAWSSVFESSTQFNSQALAVESNTFQYWASGSSVWQNNNGTNGVLLNESNVDNQAGPIGIDPVGLMYVSFHNSISNLLVPAVFSNSSSNSGVLTPLNSNSGQALDGMANGVALQSISYNSTNYAGVAAYGNNTLTSPDFTGATPLAYLLLVYNGTVPAASTTWTSIGGVTGSVNSVTFASMLTTY